MYLFKQNPSQSAIGVLTTVCKTLVYQKTCKRPVYSLYYIVKLFLVSVAFVTRLRVYRWALCPRDGCMHTLFHCWIFNIKSVYSLFFSKFLIQTNVLRCYIWNYMVTCSKTVRINFPFVDAQDWCYYHHLWLYQTECLHWFKKSI